MTSHLRVVQRVRETKRSNDINSMTSVMAARVAELQSGVDGVIGVIEKLPEMKWTLDRCAFLGIKQDLNKLQLKKVVFKAKRSKSKTKVYLCLMYVITSLTRCGEHFWGSFGLFVSLFSLVMRLGGGVWGVHM
jgi:hypothetical protein